MLKWFRGSVITICLSSTCWSFLFITFACPLVRDILGSKGVSMVSVLFQWVLKICIQMSAMIYCKTIHVLLQKWQYVPSHYHVYAINGQHITHKTNLNILNTFYIHKPLFIKEHFLTFQIRNWILSYIFLQRSWKEVYIVFKWLCPSRLLNCPQHF